MKKALVILSGGMDSVTLLYQLIADGFNVRALGFNYGQRHRRELLAASDICRSLGVPFQIMDMSGFAGLIPGSSQTDRAVDVPEGHYEEESMKQTVVPNRNMVMLSIAAAHALAHDIEDVYYGAHGGDHVIYPDCRPEFVAALNGALDLCDWKKVRVYSPFLEEGLDKGGIAARGAALGVPFQRTWTCYKGREKHCGKCGSCRERIDAFISAGVVDPTDYEVTE